jgi:hypothetical protein
VKPALQQIDATRVDTINEPMFFSHTTRPRLAGQKFQMFRFANADKRRLRQIIDQFENPLCNTRLSFHPPLQIFQEMRIND